MPLKDKKGTTITKTFQKISLNRKTNKMWEEKGSEFYNEIIFLE